MRKNEFGFCFFTKMKLNIVYICSKANSSSVVATNAAVKVTELFSINTAYASIFLITYHLCWYSFLVPGKIPGATNGTVIFP